MPTIQWRPEVNALTTPQSYRILFMPKNTAGTSDLAERLAMALPNYSEEEFRTFLATRNQLIQDSLINGEQLTEENAFTFNLSFTGRLDDPNDPLPDIDECLHVRVRALPAFVAAVRYAAQMERLPMSKKLPLISTAEDSLLKLNNVLNPGGALRLTGSDLYFDQEHGTGECVIEGTQSGSTAQTRFVQVENSEIIIMPEVPAQANPWNNEYTVSVNTHYSEHGTLRTGTYGRMLRTPLLLIDFSNANPPEVGILTGSENSPHVSATNGTVTADETLLRIQVILDLQEDRLLFSLLDMKKDGAVGAEVAVTANGTFTLPGFASSSVDDLSVRVDSYADLKDMIRNNYGGRLVDVLDIRAA